MKYIIDGREYTCKTINPHGELRQILIDAMLEGRKIEKVEE